LQGKKNKNVFGNRFLQCSKRLKQKSKQSVIFQTAGRRLVMVINEYHHAWKKGAQKPRFETFFASV